MLDFEIVELFCARSEEAINQTALKYGKLLYSVASNIVSEQDAEECVNDTYLRAWESIPPDKPVMLGAYLTKITRGKAIDLYRKDAAKKRGGFYADDELSDLIPSDFSFDEYLEKEQLKEVLNNYIKTLPQKKRVIFVKRYVLCEDTKDIAKNMGISVSDVKTSLFRMREQLGKILKKEGLL